MTKYLVDATEYETLQEAIGECYDNLSDDDKVYLWNYYCEKNRYDDDHIYSMSEFDDLCCGLSPTEVLNKVSEDFNTCHEWFKDDIYGCDSSDDPADFIDDLDLVQWLDGYYQFFSEYFPIEEEEEETEEE